MAGILIVQAILTSERTLARKISIARELPPSVGNAASEAGSAAREPDPRYQSEGRRPVDELELPGNGADFDRFH
jgi:hypothetical protein